MALRQKCLGAFWVGKIGNIWYNIIHTSESISNKIERIERIIMSPFFRTTRIVQI